MSHAPTRRPKVVNVISRLNIGGISPYVIPLTGLLRERGLDSRLVAGSVGEREGDMSYLAAQAGVDVLSVPSLGRDISPLRDMATVRRLYRLFRRERPDVVHTHTAKAGFAGRIAAWLARTPAIFHTYHGHVFHGYFGPAKTRFYLALEQFCGALSTRVLTVSDNLKRELGGVYHVARPEKVEVLIPGYDLSQLLPIQRGASDFREQFGIPNDAPLVGIVGRLVPIKNHALFLEAAARTRQAIPGARFAIIGDGELRPAVEAQSAALGLGECVHFTGWVRDLPGIYGALDALALCSKNEGLPSSVIEALVTGVPVVATAVGGVVDMLAGGLGALTTPGDADALADALIGVLRDSAARTRAEAGRAAAFALYDIQPAAARAEAFYRRFCA
ncbi:MAG: glycosyltransferase [Anaerolineae bacterium]|nr:glycosyltransferase [Anaerolineae bacterium]